MNEEECRQLGYAFMRNFKDRKCNGMVYELSRKTSRAPDTIVRHIGVFFAMIAER